MSIFPRLNQRTKVILPIRTNLSEYNEIPEHTVISANTEIPSTLDGPTVVQRYRNLTINGGGTLTTQYRCCGLALVVDGDLTITGSISMTARGASFIPNSDHLIKSTLLPGKDVVYEIDIPATANEIADFLKKEKGRYHSLDELPAIYRPTFYAKGPKGNIYSPADLGSIPAVGGAGGVGRSSNGNGYDGTAGTNRGCGGGGSGATYDRGTSGGGGAGSCYSGGSGGGGCTASEGGGSWKFIWGCWRYRTQAHLRRWQWGRKPRRRWNLSRWNWYGRVVNYCLYWEGYDKYWWKHYVRWSSWGCWDCWGWWVWRRVYQYLPLIFCK